MVEPDSHDVLFRKATLAMGGDVRLPPGFIPPFRISHSTSGPGAGRNAMVFSFEGTRVKKGISYDGGEFELVPSADGYSMLHNGEPFLENVELQPVVYHCPGQAFFTLDNRCGYHCAFCASPLLPETDFKDQRPEDIALKCYTEHKAGRISAVSFTSGVHERDVVEHVTGFVNCIRAVRNLLPGIPIGVEPYLESEHQVMALKGVGATEIKLNVQTATPELFRRVCPDLDRDRIYGCLEHAVRIFGRGHVCSNIIFGLGETREELVACMEGLCDMGVVPTLRSLRITSYNRGPLESALGGIEPVSPEYVVEIAKLHREILDRHGFDTRTFRTMCLECGCCDLVPHRDL